MSAERKVPTPPALTKEQRREAYAASLELRRKRSQIKDALTFGGITFGVAWNHSAAQGMKVYDLLTALPYIGPTKAEALLTEAGIPRKNTVRRTGPKQRDRLLALLAKRSPR